jgi:flagellar biosynthesis protein FliQ
VRIGAVLHTTVTLLQRHPVGILLATLGLAILDSALEIASGDATLSFIGSVVAIAAVYLVLRHLLRREDMVVQEGAFSSYFGASVLSSLGIVVGLLLLIVPTTSWGDGHWRARWSSREEQGRARRCAKAGRQPEPARGNWSCCTRSASWAG